MKLTKWRKVVLAVYGVVALVLCTVAVPWVHYKVKSRGKKVVAGSGYAPIWSPKNFPEYSPYVWVGAGELEWFIDLHESDRQAVMVELRGSGSPKLSIYKWFLDLSPAQRKKVLSEYRAKNFGQVRYKRYVGDRERHVDFSRLFVELLGLTLFASVAFALASPKRPGEKPTEVPLPAGEAVIEFLTKECPRCAETINLEELKCRYCDHRFDSDEVATKIRQVLTERARDIAMMANFESKIKACPECSKHIKVGAVVCHYCNHEFTDTEVQAATVKALREPVYEVPGGIQYGTSCPRCNSAYYTKTNGIYRCDGCGARFK